jgi:signal transduction histidine kinase
MIRRISNKFLVAVLAAVVLPFVAFALFVDKEMAGRLSKDVVLYSLKGLAADLALRVDRDVEEFVTSTSLLAADPGCYLALDEAERDHAGELSGESNEDRWRMRDTQTHQFNNRVLAKRDYDLLLLVDTNGAFVACNTIGRSGLGMSEDVLSQIQSRPYANELWFEAARNGQSMSVDQHVSSILPTRVEAPGEHAENYHIGFGAPIYWPRDPEDPQRSERFLGALFVLVNWSRIQEEVESPVLKSYFQGLVGPDEFPSAYGWVWKSDADTILAHRDRTLYGQSVSTSTRIRLPQMVEAARATDWGLYPEYEFAGRRKNAAFKHTRGPEAGGFGWIVGVGIDNDDIFTGVNELRALRFKATVVVLLVAVLWTLILARRTTAPILALREHVLRVGAGDLDQRVEVRSRDELGELAHALNMMTQEIKESREKLVRAEKDAAWREMARQVAHDIKNPLTPILVSVELCLRAKREHSPDFERIFERTMEIVQRQVAHLREISSDFHALTGARREAIERVDVAAVFDHVLELNSAYAQQLGVVGVRSGPGGVVLADPATFRRVALNLVSNALEAMPRGGRLEICVEPRGDRLRIEVRDTGVGVPDEVRAHLFEPYFTTRTKGTGLGLAIAKRVVEDLGGTIELVAADPAPGTIARIELPLAPSA